jgi:hypothetical protein
MGGPLHRTMADRADEHGGWHAGRANLRHLRAGCQSRTGQSVPALCVRSMDGTDTPGASVVSVCRRRLVHCRSEQEAQVIMAELQLRLAECRLEMHPTKTKIVYCKDGCRKGRYANQAFDFLGIARPRLVKNSRRAACSGVSPRGQPSGAHEHAADDPEDQLSQSDPEHAGGRRPATQSGPQGWMEYYGRYSPSALYPVFRHVNRSLVAGDAEIQTPFRSSDTGEYLPRDHLAEEPASLRALAERNCRRVRLMGAVRRESHAQFYERPEVRHPRTGASRVCCRRTRKGVHDELLDRVDKLRER